jgi:hypothetical protein
MKSTPGPWTLSEAERGDLGYTGHSIYAPKPGGESWEELWIASTLGVHVGVPLDHIEANARLIAAAPSLLEALEIIAEGECECEGEHHPKALCDRCIASDAIARARATQEPETEVGK